MCLLTGSCGSYINVDPRSPIYADFAKEGNKVAGMDELKREWREFAPEWIQEVREGRNAVRVGLLDPIMTEVCGNVENLRVLDSGCGEGRFCRILVERGAGYVLGLDLCEPMIEAARELQSDRDEYHIADVQNLSFLQDESFDLAISYLNQCDIPDVDANNREIFRVLRKAGRFIIANLHPMLSAVGTWHRSPDGTKQHVIVDNYFDETERFWKAMGITNFHRSLSTYTRSFIEAGFAIEEIIEPTVAKEQLAFYPELDDELRVPNFIIFVLRKNG